MNKLHVLYCDDQQHFIDEFIDAHSKKFDISHTTDPQQILEILSSMQRLPDILLLDLYFPLNIDDYEEKARIAKEKLVELRLKIDEVREAVTHAWYPLGLDLLEDIRRVYPKEKLPILMYTQRGLLFLDDKGIRKADTLGADWLLKDEHITPATTEIKIRNYIRTNKPRRKVKRDVALTIVGAMLGSIIGFVLNALM